MHDFHFYELYRNYTFSSTVYLFITSLKVVKAKTTFIVILEGNYEKCHNVPVTGKLRHTNIVA
jgi:hypothetical protein